MAIVKKVAFDANSLVGQKTGIGQLSYSLFSELANQNPDILFIGHYFNFMNKKQPSSLPIGPNLSYKKTVLFPSKLLNILRRIGIVLPFDLFCRKKTDLIMFPNFTSMPRLFNTPCVVFVHDLSYIDVPEFVSDKNSQYLQKWVGKSIASSKYVVTISEFTKKRIVMHYGVGESKVIVMPVPPTKITKSQNNLGKIIKNSILFVGTIEPRKNLFNLLTAYEKLDPAIRKSHPLVLAGGKGWKDHTILNKIAVMKDAGIFVYSTGYVSDSQKSALYEQASLVVQPSHYEGFGMPVLEAMSYGKPVICSDLDVFHEVAGDAAIYFDKDDPVAIRKAISRTLNDKSLRKSLINKSKLRVKNYPTWDMVAIRLSKLLF